MWHSSTYCVKAYEKLVGFFYDENLRNGQIFAQLAS
jgi:hypothetical protein